VTEIFERIAEVRKNREEAALCIVTNTKGSTPRAVGAKMLVYADGKIFGTIGGGRVEKKVIDDALNILKTRKPLLLHYDLLKDLQMCCGGSMDIYIEPVLKKNRLYIFGAGHTGSALAKRALEFDFEITVIDDRKDYLDEMQVDKVRKICGKYREVMERLPFDENTFITITTYSHPIDREILSFCIKKPNAYIGMIGSRRKAEVTKRLFEEEGIGAIEDLQRVDVPMGIDIGAEGPDEISISILAKLLAVKNKIEVR
jgi:xanthine dehydrogenase accessory factor